MAEPEGEVAFLWVLAHKPARSAAPAFIGGRAQPASARCASGRVKRPARSALPATAASHPSSRTAIRSSIDEMPPAAITGSPASSTSPRRSTSGPASEPSRAVLVTSSRLTPAAAQSLGERRSRGARAPRPTVDRDLAVADVDRDDELIGEPGGRSAEERGGERGSADHHAVGTRRDRVARSRSRCDSRLRPGAEARRRRRRARRGRAWACR